MILHFQNAKVSTQKLSELIYEVSKVAGYKINTQTSVALHILIMKYQKQKLKNNLF